MTTPRSREAGWAALAAGLHLKLLLDLGGEHAAELPAALDRLLSAAVAVEQLPTFPARPRSGITHKTGAHPR